MKYVITLLFLFVSLSSLYSCTSNSKQRNDSASIQNQGELISIKRFDQDLYRYLQSPSSLQQDSLIGLYGKFMEAFGTVTINNSDISAASYFSDLKGYFSNPMLSQIYKDALDTFSVVLPYEKELSVADELIRKYFAGKQLPTLGMHVSGFKANTIVLADFISISSDRYLGTDYSGYKDFFEDYQRQQMKPEMISRDYLKAWILTEIPISNKRKDLLAEIINEGKILYTLQLLLPNWGEAALIGYTSEQLDWSKNKEKEIWKVTVDQNYLFTTDYMTILKYLEEAPYTATISTDSPGRLGAWIGWQIVKAYAANTGASLDSIIKESDMQNILKQSKYNP
ncbi:hypothetical protein [Dysgonomonas sp. HGC4]|uniref:gliding motility lipoprotein GldB n=1 Tax=Dysgonomonas sp. HGC4 TaxID=1658009 RepID=UPI000AA606AF|nr:hypothetical protein [Dysgonomonas sp. HGC4]MBD8348350.1 hypothetical protein [Dysgonomonas sp. HGC4]